jgi:hypothetical protein
MLNETSVEVLPCPCAQCLRSADAPPQHHNTTFPSPSTRDISITMAPIDNAIAAIKCLGPGEHSSYHKVAKEFNIQHSTLRRRYQGLCALRAGEAQNRQKLSPQQELQLVQYIEDSTEQGLPPTRAMIQNFGGDVAGKACSDAWVFRFLLRNKYLLTSRWTSGMDCNCHKADSKDKYEAYLDLLHSKIQEYEVEPGNIYNMDEKE